jgi:hypothetical protein
MLYKRMRCVSKGLNPGSRALRHGHSDAVDIPNLVAIFINGSVRGKESHPRGIEDGHAGPSRLIPVGFGYLILAANIGLVVGE